MPAGGSAARWWSCSAAGTGWTSSASPAPWPSTTTGPALTAALAGVDTLVLVSSDGEAERVLQHHLNVVAAAAANDVRHVVALSSVDVDLDSPFCYARVNALTEQALQDTGCAVTAVRASIYTEFFGTLLDGATFDGELRLPAGGCPGRAGRPRRCRPLPGRLRAAAAVRSASTSPGRPRSTWPRSRRRVARRTCR